MDDDPSPKNTIVVAILKLNGLFIKYELQKIKIDKPQNHIIGHTPHEYP